MSALSWFASMLMPRIPLALVVPLLLSACSPNRFTLQRNSGWPIEGRILGNHHNVDVVGDKQVSISNSARVALRCEALTDATFDTEVIMGENDRLELQFRTTPYDDSVNNVRGMSIMIEPNLTTIISNEDTLYKAIPIPQSVPFRIVVAQHGRYVDVEVACVNVGRITTHIPSTQWVIINVDEGGSLAVIDPIFSPLLKAE